MTELQYDGEIVLALGKTHETADYSPHRLKLSRFYQKLQNPYRDTITAEEYFQLGDRESRARKTAAGAFVCGEFKGGYDSKGRYFPNGCRSTDNLLYRDALAVDLDYLPADAGDSIFQAVNDILAGNLHCSFCWYSTRSDSPRQRKMRVVIPVDRKISAAEYRKAVETLQKLILPPKWIDSAASLNPEQPMFFPTVSAGQEFFSGVNDEPLLQIDRFFAENPLPETEESPQAGGKAKQADPFEKAGIVGSFCRAYPVPEAIAEFLSGGEANAEYRSLTGQDSYPLCYELAEAGRYTYCGEDTTTTGGAKVFDAGRFLYSFHNSDQHHRKLLNSWDLVRLHCFGYMDAGCSTGLKAGEYPSCKAMMQFARSIPDVAAEVKAEECEKDFGAPASADSWEPPVPFKAAASLPDIPLDAFPPVVGSFCGAIAENLQVPPSMPGILALGVLGALFQKDFTVQVEPGWTEVCCLYVMAVALPGSGKSPCLNLLVKPLKDWQRCIRSRQRAEVAQNSYKKQMLETQLASAVKKAGAGDAAAEHRAETLSAELAFFEEMHEFQLFAEDTSAEALALLAYQQGGCINVISGEGGGICDILAGRYSKTANLDFFLKAHDGDSYTVNRLQRDSFEIESARMSVILAAQPEVLQNMLANTSFSGRGMTDRFLIAQCPQKFTDRKRNPSEIPETVTGAYNTFVADAFECGYSGTVCFSQEAKELRNRLEDIRDARMDNEWAANMGGWGGKYVGTVCRIAALFHITQELTAGRNPCDTPVSGETMQNAVNVGEAIAAHVYDAYQSRGNDAMAGPQQLWKHLRQSGKLEVSRRDLYISARSARYQKPADMDADIETLQQMGYIREQSRTTESGRGRRPSSLILINPLAV